MIIEMPSARLRIELPDGVWVADVTRAHPEITVQVLAAIPGSETGHAVVKLEGDEVPDALATMERHPALAEMDVLHRLEREAVVQFATTAPRLLLVSRAVGAPLELPITIVAGEATVNVTGSPDRVADFADRLRQVGISFEIERIRSTSGGEPALTDRQEEVLRSAIELGYYDLPRQCTMTELAEELGIAKSTCSELLQRIEATVMAEFADAESVARRAAA